MSLVTVIAIREGKRSVKVVIRWVVTARRQGFISCCIREETWYTGGQCHDSHEANAKCPRIPRIPSINLCSDIYAYAWKQDENKQLQRDADDAGCCGPLTTKGASFRLGELSGPE